MRYLMPIYSHQKYLSKYLFNYYETLFFLIPSIFNIYKQIHFFLKLLDKFPKGCTKYGVYDIQHSLISKVLKVKIDQNTWLLGRWKTG